MTVWRDDRRQTAEDRRTAVLRRARSPAAAVERFGIGGRETTPPKPASPPTPALRRQTEAKTPEAAR